MISHQANQYDVCIIGGGIVGLTLASLLAENELSIALVEPHFPADVSTKAKHGEYTLRVSAINLASMRLFEHLGIAQSLHETRTSGYHDMQIWDANSDADIHFNADDIDHDFLGYIIENDLVINLLQYKLKAKSNITFYTDSLKSFAIVENGVHIKLGTSALHAQLIVGADGQHSKVRSFAHLPTEMGIFNQTALVCRIQTERAHRQTAYQCFHHSGPIAYLPLDDGSSSIVWSCDSSLANELKRLDDDAFADKIEQALQSRLGGVEILGPRGAFDLAQQHACQYIDSHLALVGDAAHRTHPLAGLGANLGLQDAAVLAESIEQALNERRRFYSQSVLRKYERIRKHQNALVLDTMQAFKSGFASRSPALTSLRALALNAVDNSPALKAKISQLATGDSGDLPRVCKNVGYN